MIDWLLSHEWFRTALISRGWTPPNNLAGGPPAPRPQHLAGGPPAPRDP